MGQVLCCCQKGHPTYGEISDEGEPSETLSLSLKLLLLGDSFVGKSSFFKRLLKNVFETQHKPTIGPDFVTKELKMVNSNIEGKISMLDVSIQIWDSAGKQRYRDLGSVFYRGSDIVVFMYDVNDEKSLLNIELWIKNFLKINNKNKTNSTDNSHKQTNDYMGYIIGNKIDCSPNMVKEGENTEITNENENENSIVSNLLKKYDWIKGHNTISCKNMSGNQSVQTVEKLITLYMKSIAFDTEIKKTDLNTSDSTNGEKSPLLEKYQR